MPCLQISLSPNCQSLGLLQSDFTAWLDPHRWPGTRSALWYHLYFQQGWHNYRPRLTTVTLGCISHTCSALLKHYFRNNLYWASREEHKRKPQDWKEKNSENVPWEMSEHNSCSKDSQNEIMCQGHIKAYITHLLLKPGRAELFSIEPYRITTRA